MIRDAIIFSIGYIGHSFIINNKISFTQTCIKNTLAIAIQDNQNIIMHICIIALSYFSSNNPCRNDGSSKPTKTYVNMSIITFSTSSYVSVI